MYININVRRRRGVGLEITVERLDLVQRLLVEEPRAMVY